MAASNNQPDIDVAQEREEALNSLGRSGGDSLLNDDTKKKGGAMIIVILAIAALLFVFMMKGGKEGEPKQEVAEITIAPKKSVGTIQFKEDEVPPPPKEEPKPPQTAAAQPARPDPAELERLRQEAARLERERQMLEARMKSAIVAPGSQNIDPNAPKDLASGEGGLEASKGPQDINSRYARSVSSAVPMSKAKLIADLDTKILQGKLIDAILLPRAISDLPGAISCQVSRDVYSSDGRRVLIPWGSKVYGQYNAGVRKGQDRLFVIWNRLVTPSGISIALDSPGADQLGTAGMGGHVDTHFTEMFGAAFLISLMGAGAAHLGDSGSEGSAAYYREEMSESMRSSAETILSTYVNIPPTITVAAGTRVRIFVAKDLDFSDVIETNPVSNAGQVQVIF